METMISYEVAEVDSSKYSELKTTWETHGEKYTRFDWWQATVNIQGMGGYRKSQNSQNELEPEPDIDALIAWLSSKLPFTDKKLGAGRNSFERSCSFVMGDAVECIVQWGGVNPDPNITATGSHSERIREIFTQAFPEGRISRVDSAFDSMSGTDAFRLAAGWLEERARQAGVNTRWIKNSDTSIGDTLYVGSPNSRVMIRLYEKGKQTGYEPDKWWRAEVQLKPGSREKSDTYSFSSGLVWGATRITRDFMKYLTGETLMAVGFQGSPPKKDLDTSAAYMVKQYGKVLRALLADCGGVSDSFVLRLDKIAEGMGYPRITEPESGERI